jgi:hypothetical protein
MSAGAQSKKTGVDVLYTAENGFRSVKHENGTIAHGTAENVSASAQHENGT